MSEATKLVELNEEIPEVSNLAYMPYPTSTLSPNITPPDLSSFKSRNITEVERELSQKLDAIRQEYIGVIDAFNWNKMIYESNFGFEPVIGQDYHLYREGEGFQLSMIEPKKWRTKTFVGTFRLTANGQWKPQEIAEGFSLAEYIGSAEY